MNGQLNEQPLAELIREISAKGLSGALRLEHGQIRVVVYFDEGTLVYSAANVRTLRLGEYLQKHGLVREEQLAKFADKRSDLSLASALSTEGIVKARDIEGLLKTLVSDVVRVALLWTDGAWHFDGTARLTETLPFKVDAPRLLLEIARGADLDFAASRFRDYEELISPATNPPAIDSLLPAEGFLISRLEGSVKLGELLALSGLNEPEALRMIYGLAVAGFVRREYRPNVLRDGDATAAQKRPAASEVVSAPVVTPSRTDEVEIDEFCDRIDSARNHYEVLNVTPAAGSGEIKNAYYAIARRYHPDRFRVQTETPVHARIESAFARVTQAYETLKDIASRSNYDSKLAAQKRAKEVAHSAPKSGPRTGVSGTPQSSFPSAGADRHRAEDRFKEGYAALEQGQLSAALSLLAGAAHAVPEEPRYRAYYGRALAAQEKTRRSAEGELQAAIRLDSSNATYRVMLAELYRDLGFARRARAEVERALTFDPGNAAAQELLRSLK